MSDNEVTSCSSSYMETSSGEFCSEDELSDAPLTHRQYWLKHRRRWEVMSLYAGSCQPSLT